MHIEFLQLLHWGFADFSDGCELSSELDGLRGSYSTCVAPTPIPGGLTPKDSCIVYPVQCLLQFRRLKMRRRLELQEYIVL